VEGLEIKDSRLRVKVLKSAIMELGLKIMDELFADLVTAWAYRWTNGSDPVFRVFSLTFEKLPKLLSDAGPRTSPSGVNHCRCVAGLMGYDDGYTVGGHHCNGDFWLSSHENVDFATGFLCSGDEGRLDAVHLFPLGACIPMF
jgi:hypothetical protein